MKPHQLAPDQIIEWFRSKACEFNGIADVLEETFKQGLTASSQGNRNLPTIGGKSPISATAIKEYVTLKGARIRDLAEHFRVSDKEVQGIIDAPSSGLEVATRGWVKVLNPNGVDTDSLLNES